MSGAPGAAFHEEQSGSDCSVMTIIPWLLSALHGVV